MQCAVLVYTDDLREMFKVKYSPVGTNDNQRETSTYMIFLDYLYECEKGEILNFIIKYTTGVQTAFG